MLLAHLLSTHDLVEGGVVLVGVGSILSVVGLLKDKERIFPVAIVLIAFGGVLTIAPIYAESGGSAILRVVSGIAAIAFIIGALDFLGRRISRPKCFGYINNDAAQQEQAPRPIRNDVRNEQHPATVGTSTLTASEKSLANASVLIAVGLTLLMKGLYALRTAVSRN